jgi:hypothetical protein
MAHEAGVDDLKKQIDSVSDISIEDQVGKTIDSKGELADAFSIEAPKDETEKTETAQPDATPAKGDKT